MQEKLWRVNHPNEPMPAADGAADEDEDVIVADSGNDLARNVKCPISGVEVRPPRLHLCINILVARIYYIPLQFPRGKVCACQSAWSLYACTIMVFVRRC